MKILLIFITTLFFTNTSYSQNFTLSELIKLNSYKIDDFDTYVTQKGYMYYSNDANDFANTTSYVFFVNGIKKTYISKFVYKTKTKEMVSFQTGSSTMYLNIKSDLKILGFKFTNVEMNKGTTFFNYQKGLVEVALGSYVQENSFNEKLTTYEISISK